MVETAVVTRQLCNISLALQIVKLQPKAKVQTSVLGLGVDIVFPLPQQEEQPPPNSIRRGCTQSKISQEPRNGFLNRFFLLKIKIHM